jgi:hypothetical protein
VPALIIGLILRIEFLTAMPEVFYGNDSNSYFDTAWKIWTEGEIDFGPKRRFLYPILLTFMPLLPGSTAIAVSVLQHLLGLAIIVGIGWVVAQTTRLPNLWVPFATTLAAVWPRMLWYEHEMLAEVWLLAAFVAAVALALPCGALRDKQRLFWFLLAGAAIVAWKPHGRPLWLGLLLVAVAVAGNPLKWEKKSLALIALAVLIIFTSGSDRQGAWLLLNSTLPFVQTEGESYPQYRALLRPFVEKARADVENYATQQRQYKKALSGSNPIIGPKWIELTKDRRLYTSVANHLAFEAIIAHPLDYAKLVSRKVALAGHRMEASPFTPARFWQAQEQINAGRLERPKNQLQLVYGVDRNGYTRLVQERRQRTTWLEPSMTRLAGVLNWTTYRNAAPGVPPKVTLAPLGWLLALGLIACLRPRYFVCLAILWLPALLYLFAVFGVGDVLSRYLHPVEWVGIVIIVIGLDTLVATVTRTFRSSPMKLPMTCSRSTNDLSTRAKLGGSAPGT